MAIAAEIQKCNDEPGARMRYSVDFNKKNGTFGTKLPKCDKIELKKVIITFQNGARIPLRDDLVSKQKYLPENMRNTTG